MLRAPIKGGLSKAQLTAIKKLPISKLDAFLQEFWKDAFLEGLAEGEKEFKDALIMDEDEARARGLQI